MNTDYFTGEIIVESLQNTDDLKIIQQFIIKERTREMPDEKISHWNIYRYRLPRDEVMRITPLLERSLSDEEWYIHFFNEQQNEMFVILKGRTFHLPKIKDESWNEMINYGESIGVSRRWTESIPIKLPD